MLNSDIQGSEEIFKEFKKEIRPDQESWKKII